MHFDDIIRQLKIPQNSYSGRVIPKVAFYEEANLISADKKKIRDITNKVRWLYVLKPETVRIPSLRNEDMDYSEISIIHVDIDDISNADKVINVIQKSIQYPIILFVTSKDKLVISMAEKRLNQVDSTKLTIERFITSEIIHLSEFKDVDIEFLNSLSIAGNQARNLHELYIEFRNKVIFYNRATLTKNYIIDDTDIADRILSILSKIHDFEKEIISLKANIKNEKQINRQTEINVEINKLNSSKLNLINQL
jgi:hypothetical protein